MSEILAPAGTYQHIKTAIENNADAVYGGVKCWNARGRTMNFTKRELNSVIKELHEHNIKFFLTLNILLFDKELDEIISFLKHPDTVLPDAFIVTDLGLIKCLQKHFPNIPIHLSTQFGVHSVEDVKFAEKIKASRVILARELVWEEIKRLRKTTKLEVECFIFGSQCVSFSGLCYFSSFLNSGSGNRGTCLITCRDRYSVGSNFGTLLYTPDLNCLKFLPKMEGIDCVKIEGRRRDPVEIQQILYKIHTNSLDTGHQTGFIYGKDLDKNCLYCKIHHRQKPICKISELSYTDKFDVFADFSDGKAQNFVSLSQATKNTFYIYSQYTGQYKLNSFNISLDFLIEKSEITKITFVDDQGKGKVLVLPKKKPLTKAIKLELDSFISQLESKYQVNIFKISYKKQTDTKGLFILPELLNKLEKTIRASIPSKENLPLKRNLKIQKIFLETTKIEVLEHFINDPFVELVFNISSIKKQELFEQVITKFGDLIFYKLPLFNFESESLASCYQKLKNKKVIFTRFSQLEATKDIHFKEKMADYTIAPWNHITLKELKKYGISFFTASPEVSFAQNLKIFKNEKVQFILGGRLPFVYTRQCYKHLFKCKECSLNQPKTKIIKNIDKNLTFYVSCEPDYRMILLDTPILNNYPELNKNHSLRYISNGFSLKEIIQTIDTLKKQNYFEELKKSKTWENSYECNLFRKRK